MDQIFVLGTKKWQIDPSLRIIKKEQLDRLFSANEILEQSEVRVKEEEKRAQEDHKKRYEEGFAQGLLEGKEEYSLKIMESVMTQLDALEGLEKQIVEVVISAVNKVVGEIDRNELIVRLVKKGLSAVRGEKRIVIKVSHDDEKAVSTALKSSLLSEDGMSGYLEVRGDSALKKGDCIIETDMGVVEASLSSQLRILEKSLKQVVGRD